MRGAAVTMLAASLLTAGCAENEPPAGAPAATATVTTEPDLDPLTGLKMTGDWAIVRANCTACHSARLITQQRGTASQWLMMIRWMQEKQNLWAFDPVTEEKIITYLADNYAPGAARRRAALPPGLMPPNPYSTVTDSS